MKNLEIFYKSFLWIPFLHVYTNGRHTNGRLYVFAFLNSNIPDILRFEDGKYISHCLDTQSYHRFQLWFRKLFFDSLKPTGSSIYRILQNIFLIDYLLILFNLI